MSAKVTVDKFFPSLDAIDPKLQDISGTRPIQLQTQDTLPACSSFNLHTATKLRIHAGQEAKED